MSTSYIRFSLKNSYLPEFPCLHACVCMLSHVQLFCDPVACSPPGSFVQGILQAIILEQVAISSPGDLPDPQIKPESLVFPALAGGFFTTEPPGKPARVLIA